MIGKRIFIVVLFLKCQMAFAQYPAFTKWYQNPLGFKPVSLHTANGVIIPAIATTAVLIFTKVDTTIHERLSSYVDTGISFGYFANNTTVYQTNFGLTYSFRRYMSVGAELTTYRVDDVVNSTWGFGVRPFVRFYPIHRNNFKLFFQSGAGLIFFLEEFPQPSGFFGDNRMGTRLNGCPKYGLGAEIKLNKKTTAVVGAWHIHVSNGDHPGPERNPGHDSNGFSIGLSF